MDDLSQLSHERLISIIKWMAKELSEWIASESVESGHGYDKCKPPAYLIHEAVEATG